MNKRYIFHLAILAGFFLMVASAPATVITNNLAITPLNTNYDGTDLVISNCTVILDGTHFFNSLLIGAGGVLTHSYSQSGSTTVYSNVVNEPQILDAYFPATLLHPSVSGLVTVTDTNGLVTYTNGVDYIQTNLPDGTTQIYAAQTSSIPSYAVVLVTYTWSYAYNSGLFLNITNNLGVASGGSINANGGGYGPSLGFGHGFSAIGSFFDGSGAGHGGSGGMSSSNAIGGSCYGSLYQPVTLGSSGGGSYAGNGGNGGGLIQITAGGTVNIDGLVAANGADATNARAGGGAGGSIWIVTTNFSGAGSLTVNGGAGEPVHGGGGGGGRISIQCGTNNFSGSTTAYGGNGWKIGGAGTVFVQSNGATGLLLVDNGGRAGTNSSVALGATTDVVISGGAGVTAVGLFSPRNLTIATNGTLTSMSQNTLTLAVSGNLAIQSGGALSVDSLGYTAGNGTGAGHNYTANGSPYPCSGGGHAGYGALASITNAAGGLAYGSPTVPTTFGSGGGTYLTSTGGIGGGAIQLTVSGNLQLDGRITANGSSGSGTGGGGGAGGSVNINCGPFSGAGSITANGGNGVSNIGGGGGGGHIRIYAIGNSFGGSINAAGGGGANYGGAGTIYMDSVFNNPPQLILDNAGHLGAVTPLQTISSANLTVRNGATGTASSALSFASLLVSSNAWLATANSSGSYGFTGNATIQAGGGFMADAGTTGGSVSSGALSTTAPYGGGGGGHGGTGGNSSSDNNALGGSAGNDYLPTPGSFYIGLGGGYAPYSTGGYGGGYVRMTVNGTLQLDGLLTANGGNGSGLGGGGGAGGSIYLTTGTFAGSGSISANGGNGANNIGGGGGGGMIAIYFNNKSYTGSLSAFGGGGANYGGAGAIYLKTNSVNRAQILVDNAGHPGALNTISYGGADLTLRNGSSSQVLNSTSFGNVIIGTNAWLIVSNQPVNLTLTAVNITVQAGGGIIADTSGYTSSNPGPGAGGYYSQSPFFPGGGAGHGGYGANSATNSVYGTGGTFYDSAANPVQAGSAGGGNSSSVGGKGGGALSLSLSGNLQVDGTLSANGGNGSGTGGGGGSGGSLNVTCVTLAGAGTIAANGGNGSAGIGGGGAGGMIYANFTSNLFSGTISAYGGVGANTAGAGTIYFRTNPTSQTLLIVDNAGHRGTNTPLTSANNFILRNGAVAFQAYPPQTVSSLLITSNAWLIGNTTPGNNYPGLVNLTVTGNATIQAGGGIFDDAAGSAQNVGTGHGNYSPTSPYYPGGGAGHGGFGGSGPNAGPAGGPFGGNTFDSTISPSSVGSGGAGYSTFSTGGAGGGYVRLTVNGKLQLDGNITVNGGNGSGSGGGGGSGGSIYLSPGTLAGIGSLTANGGNGAAIFGGGGGGGRIAIIITGKTNEFAGTVSAYGGAGTNYGGAGTIYYGPYSTNFAKLVLDNGNNAGAGSSFDFVSMDATIQNKAIGLLPSSGSWSALSVLIRTNGTLAAPVSTATRNFVCDNLTIDAGGALSLDGSGNTSQNGTGRGVTLLNLRGGGGYGGYGGGNSSGLGSAYGSIQTPITAGSGGGSYTFGPPYGNGGYGGGALSLNVRSTLTVNGRLSANGGNGDYNCGGGSGGSLNLNFINTLLGNGIISANGGSTGGGAAGGGGGGRITLACSSNGFTGQFSASGGNGLFPGGAGTIYTRVGPTKTLLVDNGGITGTNTPIGSTLVPPPAPFDFNISGAAVVVPMTPLPLLGNLNLAAGSTLTMPAGQSTLTLAVQKNANIAGNLSVDALGFTQTNGPGGGGTLANKGAGGGYGGVGGNSSSGATGGTNYGSASQPVDFGSGGGLGLNNATGGSEGGGALRLSVGGVLNVSGNVSANGDFGWQDDSGGGAGGSIWITANTLSGLGNISASGGNGESAGGGGGGGGRIAIYSPTNLFSGNTNASGGSGSTPGQAGTIFLSATLLDFQVLSQSPTGAVNSTVSSVDVVFSEAVNPASVSAANFTLTTPAGVLDPVTMGATLNGLNTIHLTFPVQNLLGNYSLQTATTISNILGLPLAQSFTGNFTITLPTISGTVNDTNGAPVAGVLVQPDGGLTGSTTDVNGNYTIGVPPSWNGTLTPSFGTFMFVPGALVYTNLSTSLTNQNFLIVPTVAPNLSSSLNGTNLSLTWSGIPGVTYQTWSSTNLVDWLPFGAAIPGTNGLQQISLPVNTSPSLFYRLGATH